MQGGGRPGEPGRCKSCGGGGRCQVGADEAGRGGCGRPAYRNGVCLSHGGCDCRKGDKHPTCEECWPQRFRSPDEFDNNAPFIVCAIREEDAGRELREQLAAAIDVSIASGLPGWMGDSPAHNSCNMTSVQVDRFPAIRRVLNLLFCAESGLGTVLTTSADGKGHQARARA